MFSLFITTFFTIGFVVSAFYLSTFFYSLSDKFRESSERKQAHDKRLVTLLESIKQKLDSRL